MIRQIRTINHSLLRTLIKSKGEYGVALTAAGARVSVSLVEKLFIGTYRHVPSERRRERLCKFFGVTEADLFPLARDKAA